MAEIELAHRACTRQAEVAYRSAVYYLGALALLVAPAFWPSYFAPPEYEADWHVHLHGFAMFSWVALLVTQAWLMRSHRPLHRRLGKVSYALVPLIVLSTLSLAHYRMRFGLDRDLLYFFYLQVSLLTLFVTSWSLAMANRRQPAVHGRYMVCTALAIFDPIMARLLYITLGIDWPFMQVVTFAMVDAILLALVLRDRANGFQHPVYARMLVLFAVTQVPTFFIADTPGWIAFVSGFARLPLP